MKNLKEEMDNPFCFEIEMPKELHRRIDCKYHNPKVIEEIENFKKYRIQNSKIEKLGKITITDGGKRLPKGHIFFKTDYDNIPYIRATNIKNGKVDIENSEKISYEVHKKIEKYQLHKNDVVITIAGTIGETGILEDDVEICNFTENIAKISITDKAIIGKFIHLFLNSNLGKIQTQRLSVGSLQYKLSLENCRGVDIIIPYNNKTKHFNIDEQKAIIKKVGVYEKKAEKELKIYNKKVNELKTCVSESLKIKLPAEPKGKQTFPCNLLADSKDRIDALFNNPYRKKIIKTLKKYPYKKLGEIVITEEKGEILPSEFYKLVDLDDISEDLGEVINIKEVPKLESTKTVFRRGHILVSKLDPEKGKVILVDDKTDGCVGSSELVPLKLISEEVLLKYLWIILRSDYVLKQWKHEITGSSRERIGKTELENTIIPAPNKQTQEIIIKKTEKKLKQIKDSLDEYEFNKKKMNDIFVSSLLKKLKLNSQ